MVQVSPPLVSRNPPSCSRQQTNNAAMSAACCCAQFMVASSSREVGKDFAFSSRVISPARLSDQFLVPRLQQKLHPTGCNLGIADRLVLELS